METITVLMMCPTLNYLEKQLEQRFNLIRFWKIPNKTEFLRSNSNSIRAVVCSATLGVEAELIDSLPKLEIVSTFSVGLDKVDLEKCKEKGIKVTNTPDVPTEDVADMAIGLILATLRSIPECDRYVRSGGWHKRDSNLTTKVRSPGNQWDYSLGRIGKAIAKRVEAFRCPISYCNIPEEPKSGYKYYNSAVELASNCQVLVISCSLNEATHHVVNREVIDALGSNGILINIARGGLVDEPELVSALVNGRLGGAGLDVFENEPHVPEELLKLDNVVLTPHVASATVETRKAMADLVVGNLEAHFLNKPLLTPVV